MNFVVKVEIRDSSLSAVKRHIFLWIKDRRQVYLDLESVDWACRYIFLQCIHQGVRKVRDGDTGPTCPPVVTDVDEADASPSVETQRVNSTESALPPTNESQESVNVPETNSLPDLSPNKLPSPTFSRQSTTVLSDSQAPDAD